LFYPAGTDLPVELDYVYPMPQNREQDNAELTAKCTAWATLVGAGADPTAALEVVGLPDMPIVERATQEPALPPGWVPGAPASTADPDGDGISDAQDPADMANRLRKMLSNGHLPVGVG
jgi:hypothetical protein